MREFYLKNGFTDYLSKPLYPKALDETIKKCLPKSFLSRPRTGTAIPNLFIPLVEEQRLDMLNHYRETFVSGFASSGLAPDSEYYKKFTSLIESLNIEDARLQKQAVVLTEAGQKEDVQTIREVLPGFYTELQNISQLQKRQKQSGSDKKILGELLLRLEKALANNELETAEAVMKEFAAEDLSEKGRELYFRLNDLMFESDTEKIMELIKGEKYD
jgi:DNA-binding NtrC family response regulator